LVIVVRRVRKVVEQDLKDRRGIREPQDLLDLQDLVLQQVGLEIQDFRVLQDLQDIRVIRVQSDGQVLRATLDSQGRLAILAILATLDIQDPQDPAVQ
jgi:hypothetical protein